MPSRNRRPQRLIPGTGSIVARRRALRAEKRALLEAHFRSPAGATPMQRSEAIERLGCGESLADALLRELVDAGVALRLPGKDGWIAAGATPARQETPPRPRRAGSATFADLLACARAHTNHDVVAKKGRQADDAVRDLHALTPSQLADIERLAELILRHVPVAQGDPARVPDLGFRWDPTARGGRGDWTLQHPVREWAEAEHRRKHQARPNHARWTPADAMATVRNYRGAVNNLLHLAATHGLIARSPLNRSPGFQPAAERGDLRLYDVAWGPTLVRLTRWLRPACAAPQRVRDGLRVLAGAATRLGGRSLRETDWLAVRDTLHGARAAGVLPRERYEAARYAWRAVVARLGRRLPLPDCYAWPVRGELRLALVTTQAIEDAGVADVSRTARDFRAWCTPEGRYAAALVEGPAGLRDYAAWSTLPDLALRLERPALPPRVWIDAPSVATRQRRRAAPAICTTSTLTTRLRLVANIAGWAARHRGVDWTTADLHTLCDPALAEAYVLWWTQQPPDARGDRRAQLRQTVLTLAWVVNGFLGALAQQAHEGAMAAGDAAAIARAATHRETLRGWYRALERLAGDIPAPDHKDLRKVAAHIVAVAEAWRGTNGRDGLLKLGRLVDALTVELEADANGRTLDEQLAALAAGIWAPSARWAATLRLAVALLIAQRVPLRGKTMGQLTIGMWRHAPVGATQQRAHLTGALAPWEGALSLDIPAALMKSKRPFAPAVMRPDDVATPEQEGNAARERALRRPLLALWFIAGGGRDICRTVHDPETGAARRLDVPWLFPDLLPGAAGRAAALAGASPAARSLAWSRAALSTAFGRAVRRHAVALSVDVARLRALRGALGFHVVRRLFGTYWAPRNLVWCSRLLDHVSIALTATLYTAQDERTMALDAEAEEASREPAAMRWAAEREQLLALLEATTGELQALRIERAGRAA